MVKEGFRSTTFRTIYLSKELINNPLIPKFINFLKKIKQPIIANKDTSVILSIGFGKRVLINGPVKDYNKISRDDLIEIVDYDPIKNNLMIIGENEALIDTPLHWMIHHARDEVNVVFQINNKNFIDKNIKKYPITKKELPPSSLEQIKEVMKNLRNSKIVLIKDRGLLITANIVQEIEKSLEKIVGDKNEN